MKLNEGLLVFCAIILSEVHAQLWPSIGCVVAKHECPNENVQFFLYNRDRVDNPIELNVGNRRSLLTANFVEDRPLIFLIHGYTGDRDFSPNTEIRPAYLEHDDFNIISLDYSKLAAEPCYMTAVGNLQTVANCTAQLIDSLIDANVFTLDQIHVIGFSLGGQVAGMIANYLKDNRKLKRITSLDPAKPMFIFASTFDRIDPSDAEFVQ